MTHPAFSPGPSPFLGKPHRATTRPLCRISAPVRPPLRPLRMVGAAPVQERVTKKETKPLVERKTKLPPMYRLYIYNDPMNKRERVVDVLLKTCQGLSFSRAYAAMQEAHENGRGLVVVVCLEVAEHYCATINGAGVLSTIEPDD